jgi:hypothetical protein
LAPSQGQLLDGIHLPDVMGMPRGVPLLRGLATSGRRRWLGQPPPALEGSLARNGKARVQLRQADADEAGSPTRVGLVQEQGFLDQGVAGRQDPLGRTVLG